MVAHWLLQFVAKQQRTGNFSCSYTQQNNERAQLLHCARKLASTCNFPCKYLQVARKLECKCSLGLGQECCQHGGDKAVLPILCLAICITSSKCPSGKGIIKLYTLDVASLVRIFALSSLTFVLCFNCFFSFSGKVNSPITDRNKSLLWG